MIKKSQKIKIYNFAQELTLWVFNVIDIDVSCERHSKN